METKTNVTLPKKANLGCGPLPLYPQDLKYMDGELSEWILVDLFIKGPGISNWDIEVLDEIPDEWLEEIYTSHALEHISHRKVLDVLKLWARKLQKGGKITVIVPDLMYAFKQLRAVDNDQVPNGLYNQMFGLHSPLSIIYGGQGQPGEYHLGGFTAYSLTVILHDAGFVDIQVDTRYEDHQMDSLIATAQKP